MALPGLFPIVGQQYQNFTYDDGNLTPVNPPFDLKKNVTLVFEPGFFNAADESGAIYINLTFGVHENMHPGGHAVPEQYRIGHLIIITTRPM